MILGIADFSVALVYLLMIFASLLCIIYGFRMWNREGDVTEKEMQEEIQWAREEMDLERDLADDGGRQ